MAEIDSRIFDSTFWEKAWAEAGRLRREKTGINSSSIAVRQYVDLG